MDFIKLTLIEIKGIFKSKFLLILTILLLLMSVAMPVIGAASGDSAGAVDLFASSYGARMAYVNSYTEEAIVVDGVTIEPDNPFYWNLRQYEEEKNYNNASNFAHPESYDLWVEMGDMEKAYYLKFATQITAYEDYRYELTWYGSEKLYDIFIYEHNDMDQEVLKEALNWRRGYDESTFETKYITITQTQKQERIADAQAFLDRVYKVIDNNDFVEYISISIDQQGNYIAENQKQIDTAQAAIADLESQKAAAEKEYNEMVGQNADSSLLDAQSAKIEGLQRQIDSSQDTIDNYTQYTETINSIMIPTLNYRLEHHIVPGDGSWQDKAISSKQNSENQLTYTKLLTEEEFNSDQNMYLREQYRTYAAYKTAIQKQIDGLNKSIIIAQQSLDNGKPDMSFVPGGARSQTANFLYFSMFVALLSVVIGGWLIASEFQFGTIRLLIIRPKTRMKILMSKFAAGLAVSLGIYIAGALVNLLLNGALFGFSDLGNPNYTVGGQVGFIGYYLPKFFACMITILFGYCAAFMLSTVVKNIAVSISVPIVCFIGCYIGVSLFAAHSYMSSGMPDWIAYTPVPYVQVSSFFVANSSVDMLMNFGAPLSLGYGLGLLSGLSVLFTLIAAWVFKKKDITN